MGHLPVGMEMFNAADEEQWRTIERTIQFVDYYCVIVAHRYGSTIGDVSYTEKEYEYARSLNIPTLGFLIEESAEWPANQVEQDEKKRLALAKFKEKIRTKMVSFWRKPDDLGGQFAIALNKAITLNPRPGWIRSTDAPSEKVVEELTRLSQENHSLRDKLDQLNSISPMNKEVDDVVSRLKNAEINIYFEITLSGKLINKEYSIQEKTIFLTIAQLASTGVIEDDLKYGLPHLITGESSASWSE